MRLFLQLLVLFSVTLMSLHPARADSPPTSVVRPETVKIAVGDVVTRVEAAKMWTMSGFEYRGTVMAVEDSAYGSVITLTGYGHLGTAHFLDVPGKPGDIEKEQVHEWTLFIDGNPVKQFQPQTELRGDAFRMERKSNIRALRVESTVDIRDNIVVETARYSTDEPIQLDMTYPLMYAWSPANTDFAFGDDRDIIKTGQFLGDDQKPGEGLEKTARWMAVFDRKSGKGSVLYLLEHPKTADGWFQFTDAPGIYRKLRIMSFVKQTVPAGFDGLYRSVVGFFEAELSDWQRAAQARVQELKAHAAGLEKQ